MVSTEPKMVKLDLACGGSKKEGFTGVDICKLPGVDIVMDLQKYPWAKFKSNSVDEIHISHFIEHVSDFSSFMNEVYRILKPGGKCQIIAPYYNSIRAWQDPTHVRAISEATFLYCNKEWRDQNKLGHYQLKCNFNFTYAYNMSPMWASKHEEARTFAINHYTNVVSDIIVFLTKI